MSGVFEIDLTNYKERRGDRVPEGTYRVRVHDTELTDSKQGNPMMNMWLLIVDDDEDVDGSIIIDRLVATKKSAFRVVHALKAMGINVPKGKLRLPERAVRGRTMLVTVADDEYNNVTRSAVQDYLPDPEADAGGTANDLPTVEDGDDDDEGEALTAVPDDDEDDDTPVATVNEDGSVDVDAVSI